MIYVGAFIGAAAALIPLGVWGGYVLSVMWGWFVAPLGVPSLSVAQAVGIMLLVGFLRPTRTDGDDKGYGKFFLKLGSWFVGSLLTLCLGYIAKGFM